MDPCLSSLSALTIHSPFSYFLFLLFPEPAGLRTTQCSSQFGKLAKIPQAGSINKQLFTTVLETEGSTIGFLVKAFLLALESYLQSESKSKSKTDDRQIQLCLSLIVALIPLKGFYHRKLPTSPPSAIILRIRDSACEF